MAGDGITAGGIAVRKAKPEELDRLMEFYRAAQEFMIRSGNPHQWGRAKPARETVAEDIAAGRCHVVLRDGAICGVFALCEGEDPTYRVIEGAWRSDGPYLTIHRVAGDGTVKGVFRAAADYCKARCDSVRVDTHADNLPMQGAVTKAGFVYCGVIHLPDGAPRLAYQWVRETEDG